MASPLQRHACGALLGMLGNEAFCGQRAGAFRTEHIDDALGMKFCGRVHTTVRHHAFGFVNTDAPDEQTHGTRTRKQTKNNLREAEFAMLLRNEVVGGQCELEASAEGATLY